ncbi:MAG: hypothetical protein COC12_08480 [Rhodobacteraceae bacterium]|nr:MAG: hypothetical protein COC12_08480 [Paracoccaceae bacterium]
MCISLPFLVSFIANIARKRPERNRDRSMLRLDIKDARWRAAMDAIRAAIRVVGSKTYVRCYHRLTPDAAWQNITIDLAKA